MLKIAFAATTATLLAFSPALASAQETSVSGGGSAHGSFGLGAQSMLRGPGGASVTIDLGQLHIDGILYFVDTDGGGIFGGDDAFGLAGRVFYHIHQSERADLGLGGGLGITLQEEPGDDETLISVEVGAKMRAFIVSNVALTAFVGLGLVVDSDDDDDDDDALVIGGQQVGSFSTVGLTSGFGFTYFFD